MKVRAIFETGSTRVVLIAESDAEKRLLGALGTEVHASVEFRHEGHVSYAKVATAEVTLRPAQEGGAA